MDFAFPLQRVDPGSICTAMRFEAEDFSGMALPAAAAESGLDLSSKNENVKAEAAHGHFSRDQGTGAVVRSCVGGMSGRGDVAEWCHHAFGQQGRGVVG